MRLPSSPLGGLCPILALTPLALPAQGTQTCSITGATVDEAGQPLEAARVRLTSPSLQGARLLTTDARGRFIARLLPPGVYALEIQKAGFQTLKVQEPIGVDQNYQPRFTLAATATAMVEVVASAPAVDKTDVRSATNFRLDAVDRLPQGRSQEQVAALAPGVTGGVGGRPQIRGAMTSGNLYLLDGQNIADNAFQTPGVALIEDAVEETQVITGALPAEYGNVDGGVINSITRSGSNVFSGQVRLALSNPAWNAAQPFYDRAQVPDRLDQSRTFSLGGYLLKDRIWFFASFYRTGATDATSTPGDALVRSAPYVATTNETRRQLKFTFLLSQAHTLVTSFMDSLDDAGNRSYNAGDLLSLVPQHDTSGLYSVSLRSVWGAHFTTEGRFGGKTQLLNGGSARNNVYPVVNDADGYFYYNGPFNKNDGGDHRRNRSLGAKASLFWDAAGAHQTDFGLDWLETLRVACNDQSPADDAILEVASIPDYAGRMLVPKALITYTSSDVEATNTSKGLYLNDKWSLDQHLTFQLGLREDWYSAQDGTGRKTVSARGCSPRLGLKYDLLGDSAWILGLSWARYTSGVAEGISDQVTNAGNPKEVDFKYSGPPVSPTNGAPYAQAADPANYARTPGNVTTYLDPYLNVKLSQGMGTPHVDETQASAAYAFRTPLLGEGFLRLTAVWKTWRGLFDYRSGQDGTVNDAFGTPHYLRVWANSPLARRTYRDLELDAETRRGPFSAGGNVTWARLEGNYEGEGGANPFRGEGLQNFTTVDGQVMYDNSLTTPYGKLEGDMPIRIRATASYEWTGPFGTTVLGLVYRFNSGGHYSLIRSIDPEGLNPALPSDFGSSATQYFGGARGQFVSPASVGLDLALTQTLKLATVAGAPVNLFVKLILGNVLNHQQVTGMNVLMEPFHGPGAASAAWVPKPEYGTSDNASYRGSPRTVSVSAGLRF